jgi:hypothetical protein
MNGFGIKRHCQNLTLKFNKRGELFVGMHNKAPSVAAVRVNNPDRSPFKIQRLGKSPSFMTDSG